MKSLATLMVLALSASTLFAAPSEKRIPTLKVGKCKITVLDSNGIKPLSGATLDLKNAEDGKTAVSAVANKSGLCEIKVAEGRYILSVNEKPITLIDAKTDGQLAWARIVLSDTPMMVGGQEGTTTPVTTYTLFGVKYSTLALATAAAVAAGVGVDQIVENNEGGSSSNNNNDQQDNQDNQQDSGGSPSGASN